MSTIVKKPNKMTEKVVEMLQRAFMDGSTVDEAVAVAKIDKQTYYNWRESFPEFSTKMDDARNYVDEVARMVVAKDITKNKNTETAKWWLERRKKSEFSTRSEHTGADGKDLVIKIQDYGTDSNTPTETT